MTLTLVIPSQLEGLQGVIQEEEAETDNHQGCTKHLFSGTKIV